MIRNLVGFISQAFGTTGSTAVTSVKPMSANPFANSSNPFISQSTSHSNSHYGKNAPVRGGYFAGYYNGKPNIVGRQLFLEV